jgi:AraC-like DNA-binding protein
MVNMGEVGNRRMIPRPAIGVYQKISIQKSTMEIDLNWASVFLLPSMPYSVHEVSNRAVLGFAFEKQTGVHAIGGGARLDFDAWPGELAITKPHVEIFSESINGGEYLTLHVGASEEFEALQNACIRSRAVVPGDRKTFALGLKLRRLMLSQMADHLEIEEQAALLFHTSLVIVNRPSKAHELAWSERKRHVRVLEYIEANLSGPVRLDELARVAGMAKLRFLRSFIRTIGITPHGFITERRLQRARMLLKRTDAPIASIAYECGFAHQSHLGSVLHSQIGLTPVRYRKALR